MQPGNTAPDSSLISRLAVECAAWKAMLNVMSEEERALINGEADVLAGLNASKLGQLHTLNNLASTRNHALLAAGHTADQAGMQAWLTQHGQAEHLLQWQQLSEMEQQAQALNQRIGKLIDMRLTATRQALNVLVHATSNQGGLYDQAGQSTPAHKGKPLTAA